MNSRSLLGASTALKNSFNVNKFNAVSCLPRHTSQVASSLHSFREVQIPVPWGHVSAKWWGKKDVTPIIGLHGFEDNAGTFDRLAPLLEVPAFLAWDAPGHGKSSHYPKGMVYTFVDFVITLRRIVQYFEWKKISIVGHSFGSCMGHIYSSLFPSEVDRFVSLDCARTLMATGGSSGLVGLTLLRKQSEQCLKAEAANDPPGYMMETMIDVFCNGTFNSVPSEYAHILLDRGSLPHPNKPDHFYFSRDHKLRYSEFNRPDLEILNESAQNIKCHVLNILGSKGYMNSLPDTIPGKAYYRLEELVKESAASYSRHIVDGTHHLHLSDPERVAPLINKFFTQ